MKAFGSLFLLLNCFLQNAKQSTQNRNQEHPQQAAPRILKTYQTTTISINNFINSEETCRFQNAEVVHQNISVPQKMFCVGPAMDLQDAWKTRCLGQQRLHDGTGTLSIPY